MQKPITEKRLENIALFYLERFEASSEKLRQVLKRRVSRQKMQGICVPPEHQQWIENVVEKMIQMGYVDDARYAENAVRRWSEQGKSAFMIRQKLQAERIDSELIEQTLENNTQNDLDRARVFARKRNLGHTYEKDLEKLARAGFSYDIAKKVLTQEETDA